ncbi:MAG: carbonic anhydrase [Clostridiaceae bacterium]
MKNRFFKKDSKNIINIDSRNKKIISADTAKEMLVEGNQRYISGRPSYKKISPKVLLDLYENGQHPYAAIVTCSDSRVSPELIFDAGLGEIFVVRNAGNIADSLAVGSIEYAVKILKVPLVIVLGHDKCGAVKAAVEEWDNSPDIKTIVRNITPAVEKVKADFRNISSAEIALRAENENISLSVNRLLESSIIKEAKDSGNIDVILAKYDMVTGKVKFPDFFQLNSGESKNQRIISI